MNERLRDIITDSLRYWEPRRLAYNVLLACVVLVYFFASWPFSRNAVTFDGILYLFVLAVLANVAYCAAYLCDVFVQLSGFRDVWRRVRGIVFAVGMIFAAIIARFFAEGFFRSP